MHPQDHEDQRAEYSEWLCDAFAIAAHRVSGQPMAVWTNEAQQHACVVLSKEPLVWLDADGKHPPLDGWTLHFVNSAKQMAHVMHKRVPHDEVIQDAEEFILADPELCTMLKI